MRVRIQHVNFIRLLWECELEERGEHHYFEEFKNHSMSFVKSAAKDLSILREDEDIETEQPSSA